MKRIVADLHMHTIASGHAYGTIREMAQAAKDINLKLIGISEHAPGIPGTVKPIYFSNVVNSVPKQLYGIRVIHGSEVNLLDDASLSLEDKYLNKLDYAIVGIHTLCYENKGVEENTNKLVSCFKNKNILFVSHPDDDKTPLDYEKLVFEASKNNVCLEVNNSSLLKPQYRLNCYENYHTMLKLCIKHQCMIVVNSDAHDPSQVGNIDLALKLLDELNFPDDLVLNNDVDKIFNYLNLKKSN